MRLLRVHIPVFIVVLTLVAGLLAGPHGVHPACAQLSSGEVGLFLDPAGTIYFVSTCISGDSCHPELWEFTPEGYLKYTVYVLGKDLERGTSAYEFAIQSYSFYPETFGILSPTFPQDASYGEWGSATRDGFPAQINYAVELPYCLPDQGLITLATIEVTFKRLSLAGLLVTLVGADCGSQYPPCGYRPCDASHLSDRISLPISGNNMAGIYLPDPAAELSWGRVKTEFR